MPSWVVIGASRGIGLAYVQQLAADPSNIVFALVRNLQSAIHLKPHIGGNVHAIEADFSKRQTLKAAAEEVAKVTGGSLDYLINNGAKVSGQYFFTRLTDYEGIEDQVDDEYIDTFRVNVLGPMHSILAFLPLLRAGNTKKIINISSAAADLDFQLRTGSAMMTVYGITKAGLNTLTTKFANTLKDEGFICVSVSPGLVDTQETTVGKPGEKIPGFDGAQEMIRRAYPEWTPVAYTPDESVKKQLEMILNLKPEDNGTFVSEKGTDVLFGA